jgi:hypothetical protein
MTIVVGIFRLIVVVGHIVSVVQIDNLGGVFEDLVALARNGQE